MSLELPVFTRCCFCLPLRYGLLGWGYFKLIVVTALTILFSMTLRHTIMMNNLYRKETHQHQYLFDAETVVSSIVIIVFITDVVLSSLFIAGGHMKNLKLLRVYYFYSIGFWVVTVLLTTAIVILSLWHWYLYAVQISSGITMGITHILDFSWYFLNIVIHAYFLLLLRSEIRKLESNHNFLFKNNAAESECTMKYNDEIMKGTDVGEKGTERSETRKPKGKTWI